MRSSPQRLRFIFVTLVTLALVAMGWLAYVWAGEERNRTEERFQGLITQQLDEVEERLQSRMEVLDRDLLDSYQKASFDVSKVENSLALQVFEVDGDGKLAYPLPQFKTVNTWANISPDNDPNWLFDTSNSRAKGFYRRTASLWESGRRLGEGGDENEVIEDAQLSSYSVKQEVFSNAKRGWYRFFYHDDVHYLHWMALPQGRVLGAEMNRAAMLARLIGSLPDSGRLSGARVVLQSASQQNLYQWGDYEFDEGEEPLVVRALESPFESWQLSYYGPGIQEKGNPFGRPGGWFLLLLPLLFLVLAVWYYHENGRALREARQQVSFVNQVSHELKTPLTNIRLYSEMAQTEWQQREEEEGASMLGDSLEVVKEETKRLSRLIHNVLSFARKEQKGKATGKLRVEVLALAEVVQAAHHQWEPVFERRGIELKVEGEEGLNVIADRDALLQVLGNLFSNLEKYGGEGSEACLSFSHESEERVKLRLQDSGPGVPKKLRKRIFEPFYRVRTDLSEGTSGTGIGLSISRELMREMGGELRLCPVSQGACFEIILPC